MDNLQPIACDHLNLTLSQWERAQFVWSEACNYWLLQKELPLSLHGETLEDWQRVAKTYQALVVQRRMSCVSDFQAFVNQYFKPIALKDDAHSKGLLTGYFHPHLKASCKPVPQYPYPIYTRPDDLILVEDAGCLHPKAAGVRIGGRLSGHTIVPYDDREKIEGGSLAGKGLEIAYVDDLVDLFFAHIQGSARLVYEDGSSESIYYNGTNGYAYTAIGQTLIDQGALSLDNCTMDTIKNWLRTHKDDAAKIMHQNQSFVFFQKSPRPEGPLGFIGLPLVPEASLAVDPRYIPLGSMVLVHTTHPLTQQAYESLTLAMDVGGAIKGPLRGDFYWGEGDAAGQAAGAMQATVRMSSLVPKGF